MLSCGPEELKKNFVASRALLLSGTAAQSLFGYVNGFHCQAHLRSLKEPVGERDDAALLGQVLRDLLLEGGGDAGLNNLGSFLSRHELAHCAPARKVGRALASTRKKEPRRETTGGKAHQHTREEEDRRW